MGSRAQHMWRERGDATEKGFGHRPNLCLYLLCGPRPWKAGGGNIVEQISSNLSLLVCGSSGERCSPVPSPPLLEISPVYPSHCQHIVRGMRCQWGVSAVGISSRPDRPALPWVDHSCVLSAGLCWPAPAGSGQGVVLALEWPGPTCTVRELQYLRATSSTFKQYLTTFKGAHQSKGNTVRLFTKVIHIDDTTQH